MIVVHLCSLHQQSRVSQLDYPSAARLILSVVDLKAPSKVDELMTVEIHMRSPSKHLLSLLVNIKDR